MPGAAPHVYVALAFLAIFLIVHGSCREMFTDRRQPKYMRPVNPLSSGFSYEV